VIVYAKPGLHRNPDLGLDLTEFGGRFLRLAPVACDSIPSNLRPACSLGFVAELVASQYLC
jgi:hypothetical protein